jgi:hypothetical protein
MGEKVAAATLLAATFDLAAKLEPEMELALTLDRATKLETAVLEMVTAFEIPATVSWWSCSPTLSLRGRKGHPGRISSGGLVGWMDKGVWVFTWVSASDNDMVAFSASARSSFIAASCSRSIRFVSSCNRPCVQASVT